MYIRRVGDGRGKVRRGERLYIDHTPSFEDAVYDLLLDFTREFGMCTLHGVYVRTDGKRQSLYRHMTFWKVW